jgi:hypothetical protein
MGWNLVANIKGPAGAQGTPGPQEVYSKSTVAAGVAIATTPGTAVVVISSVPAGKYIFEAEFDVVNVGTTPTFTVTPTFSTTPGAGSSWNTTRYVAAAVAAQAQLAFNAPSATSAATTLVVRMSGILVVSTVGNLTITGIRVAGTTVTLRGGAKLIATT